MAWEIDGDGGGTTDDNSNNDHVRENGGREETAADGEGRSDRATGGDSGGNVEDRAVGENDNFGLENRESLTDSKIKDSNFSLLGGRKNETEFHLVDGLNEPAKEFSLGVDYENLGGGERAANWTGIESVDAAIEKVIYGAGYAAAVGEFVIGGTAVMFGGVNDKYGHSATNCFASKLGPGGVDAATQLSDMKEKIDQSKAGNTIASEADSREDQKANRLGREAGMSGERCLDAAERIRNLFK